MRAQDVTRQATIPGEFVVERWPSYEPEHKEFVVHCPRCGAGSERVEHKIGIDPVVVVPPADRRAGDPDAVEVAVFVIRCWDCGLTAAGVA